MPIQDIPQEITLIMPDGEKETFRVKPAAAPSETIYLESDDINDIPEAVQEGILLKDLEYDSNNQHYIFYYEDDYEPVVIQKHTLEISEEDDEHAIVAEMQNIGKTLPEPGVNPGEEYPQKVFRDHKEHMSQSFLVGGVNDEYVSPAVIAAQENFDHIKESDIDFELRHDPSIKMVPEPIVARNITAGPMPPPVQPTSKNPFEPTGAAAGGRRAPELTQPVSKPTGQQKYGPPSPVKRQQAISKGEKYGPKPPEGQQFGVKQPGAQDHPKHEHQTTLGRVAHSVKERVTRAFDSVVHRSEPVDNKKAGPERPPESSPKGQGSKP